MSRLDSTFNDLTLDIMLKEMKQSMRWAIVKVQNLRKKIKKAKVNAVKQESPQIITNIEK